MVGKPTKEGGFRAARVGGRSGAAGRRAIAVLVAAAFLAACGSGSDRDAAGATEGDVADETVPSTERETEATDTGPVAIGPADTGPADTGPEPMSEPSAERIVVSDQAVLDAALALDLPVVAIPGYADREAIPAYLADRAEGIEVLAERSQVNLESLAAARPDLLLFSSKLVEESGAREQIEAIAPLAELDASTARPWRDVLREVAAAAGVPDRADPRIEEVDATIAAAGPAIGPEGLAREVSVVRCFGNSCRYLPGGTSFSGQVLDEIGVTRPAVQASDPEGRAFVEVSPERVDLLDGDIIILFGTDAEDTLAQLRQNPLWEQLRAVQNDAVYEVDAEAWFTGNAIAVETIVADIVRLLQ
jgi:iron complex transport system substrate-binding protein